MLFILCKMSSKVSTSTSNQSEFYKFLEQIKLWLENKLEFDDVDEGFLFQERMKKVNEICK